MFESIKKFYIPTILIVFLVVFGFFYSGPKEGSGTVNAASEGFNLAGWAWSDNIGWISFSCSNTNSCNSVNYRVVVADNGDISGYAWSDNIGWISFNQGDLSSCPSGACKAKLSGNNLNGWAKAISADYFGWDGFIDLGQNGSTYGVSYNSGTKSFSGYAWGSDVVGWVKFSGFSGTDGVGVDENNQNGNSITVALDAFPTAVTLGGTTKLFWTNENISTCNASSGLWTGSWTGNEALNGFKENVGPILTDTTYTIKCSNVLGEEKEDSVLVTVIPPDFSLQKSGNVEIGGVRGTSTPTTLSILPQNSFSSAVNLSVSYLPPQLSGAKIVLSKSSLSSSVFGSGSEFRIIANNPIATGSYLITIQGQSGGLTRTINVVLNVDNKKIKVEEF
ncbi:MAG: hypothetical protein Athens071416_276 [Parcubacteria group bacterium Athens0714_16]|nr:MAG: hypothetical protein Athens071416_276 [Parcubacteria group bacterium Athens0714_16]